MEKLRECREKAHLSQKMVALEVGVRPPTVSQWESGVKKPSRKNIIKLANLYHVSADYLLDMQYDSPDISESDLSPDEKKLVQDYRNLNQQGQEYIRQTMHMALPVYIKHTDVSGLENKIG